MFHLYQELMFFTIKIKKKKQNELLSQLANLEVKLMLRYSLLIILF